MSPAVDPNLEYWKAQSAANKRLADQNLLLLADRATYIRKLHAQIQELENQIIQLRDQLVCAQMQ